MNRRDFCTYAAGAATFTAMTSRLGFGSLRPPERIQTTPFYVRGLAMIALSGKRNLWIALPEAPHHQATFRYRPKGGRPVSIAIAGRGRLIAPESDTPKPEISMPAIVSLKELYPEGRARIWESPTLIAVPWGAVVSASVETFSEEEWTFVDRQTGKAIESFEPRRLAETLRFDLLSSTTLEFNDEHTSVNLSEVDEIQTDFVPSSADVGDFTDHFSHYMAYVDRGEDDAPDLAPRAFAAAPAQPPATPMDEAIAGTYRHHRPVSGGLAAAPVRRRSSRARGSSRRLWPYDICYPFAVG